MLSAAEIMKRAAPFPQTAWPSLDHVNDNLYTGKTRVAGNIPFGPSSRSACFPFGLRKGRGPLPYMLVYSK